MVQTNLEGEPIKEREPLWMVGGEDCRYWLEEEGSEEYKQKKRKYDRKGMQKWVKRPNNREKKRRRQQTPEFRKKRREYYRKRFKDPKYREERRVYHQKQRQNPEYREKEREYNQKYRMKPENKEHMRQQKQKRRQEFLEWVWLVRKPICVCCGNYEKRLMNFHHIFRPKLFTITSGMNKTKDDVFIEMEKCVVLCSNCHKMLHTALGTNIVKPFSEIISVLYDQPHYPIMKWLIFLLYSDIYPQNETEWHEVWGNSE